mgnify:CR=1 FL=1
MWLIYTSYLHHILYVAIITCVKGKVKYSMTININTCKMSYLEFGGA